MPPNDLVNHPFSVLSPFHAPSTSSRSGPMGGIVLLRETIWASHTGTKGGVCPFGESPKVLGNAHASASSLVSQIVLHKNNHECTHKTQFTYARINCVLKDSSCDTPLPKILLLAILATCASQAQQKVSKCPHMKNDSIFTHKG
ncbi:hypothetical protein H5410_037265 [Solanum commersonii]|uniref:Uncharacterized protein n=1 Tax=Solanum commersonii TaxID=4109 RepID=A0A9J5Y6M3_SOLCO|nr:hypothetical protein H5410_037265 [Solanum commersonii]